MQISVTDGRFTNKCTILLPNIMKCLVERTNTVHMDSLFVVVGFLTKKICSTLRSFLFYIQLWVLFHKIA